MAEIRKTQCWVEQPSGTLSIEASTVGLKPGEWPKEITIKDGETDLVFMRGEPTTHKDYLFGFNYFRGNARLLVLND